MAGMRSKKKTQTPKEKHIKGRRKGEPWESLECGNQEGEAEESVQLKPMGKKVVKKIIIREAIVAKFPKKRFCG